MPKPAKANPVRDRKLKRQIVRQVCDEFNVTPRELSQRRRGKENLLRLMVIFLARELSGKSAKRASASYNRFRKYLKFVPGLSEKCEELKQKIIRKVDGF